VSRGLQGDELEVDESITASRLFEYINKHVNEWAKVNRAREQVPVLLGGGRDPELLRVAKPKAKDEAKKEDPDDKAKKEEAPKAAPAGRFNPESLRSAWKSWMVLKRDYAPQVYSPHYWRLYQESLLRLEQLARAGDPTEKADGLKKKLASLESEIKTDKSLDKAFDCLGNSFPLPRALGFHPKDDFSAKDVQAALKQWKKNTDDHQKAAQALKMFTSKSELQRRYWQTRLTRAIVNAGLNQPDFDQAVASRDLAKLTDDLSVPQRSAEVHLVKMLRDVDPKLQQPDLIQLALRVRMLAEESALGAGSDADRSEPYADVIFKRMETALKKADDLRREGEDRIIGNPKAQSAIARAKLQQAEEAYKKIHKDAQDLRQCLALRDDLAADVPFLSAAVATLPSVSPQTQGEVDGLQAKAQSLGVHLAALTTYLDKNEGKQPPLQPIKDDLQYVREHYRILSETLRGLGADLQKNWHALDGVLSMPPPEAGEKEVELRLALLTKMRDTAHKLDVTKFREPQIEVQESTVAMQKKLLRSAFKLHAEEIKGEAKNVDDGIRNFFLEQFKETFDASADPEKEQKLDTAVNRSRVMLAYLADQLIDARRDRINPAKRLRNLRTYHLLTGLARRTLEDHWFDHGAKDEPTYYGPVAKAYLDSASKILEPKNTAMIKERDELKRRLARAGVTIEGDAKRYWTTESQYTLDYTVRADPEVPAGFPTVWFETPNGSSTDRETVRDWPAPYPATTNLSEEKFAAGRKVPCKLHVWYRGQHLFPDLTVNRPPPDIIARYTPGPDKVGFAVRMDKLDYGAVSIIIDNSGSMRTLHPKDGENRDAKKGELSRYHFAMKALEEVLNKLPYDTYLSVSAFDGNKTTGSRYMQWHNGPADQPYEQWRGNKETFKKLMADMEEVSPFKLSNYSPIAKAIIKTMDEGFPPNFRESKLVVVLTDGMDNYSYDEKAQVDKLAKARNNKRVKEHLEEAEAKHPKTEVLVVCFISQDDDEIEDAKDQFEIYARKRRLVMEADGTKLGRVIEKAITPHIQIKRGKEIVAKFNDGQPVNYRSTGSLTWHPLQRDDYQVRLLNSGGPASDLKQSPGDNLFATVRRADNKFILERGIVGNQPEVERNRCLQEVRGDKKDWLVTLLQNQKSIRDDSRSQLIAFEKMTLDSGSIRQTYPGFVWLEVQTPDGRSSEQTLEWGSDLVVPAPAYSLNVANWPEGSPKLNAWFWPRTWENMLDTVKPVMDQRINIKNYVSRPGDLIERLRWENRLVGVMTPKGPVEMKKECLVIQARYLDGKPVYFALKAKNERLRIGSEHRFYHEAGKSTAFFYDLPLAQEDVDIVAIPVPRFQEAAAAAGGKVEFAPRDFIDPPPIFRKDIEKVYGERR
jgi:hypothetical protein